MIIPPNVNGWSYDDSTGNWKLVYADSLIVIYEQTDQPIATGSKLFVGTEQECDAEIARLNLKHPHEIEEIEEQ
jgi:hypothetical protein